MSRQTPESRVTGGSVERMWHVSPEQQSLLKWLTIENKSIATKRHWSSVDQ